jgi:hypothetical protein
MNRETAERIAKKLGIPIEQVLACETLGDILNLPGVTGVTSAGFSEVLEVRTIEDDVALAKEIVAQYGDAKEVE